MEEMGSQAPEQRPRPPLGHQVFYNLSRFRPWNSLVPSLFLQNGSHNLARVGDKARDHLTGGGKADVLPRSQACISIVHSVSGLHRLIEGELEGTVGHAKKVWGKTPKESTKSFPLNDHQGEGKGTH